MFSLMYNMKPVTKIIFCMFTKIKSFKNWKIEKFGDSKDFMQLLKPFEASKRKWWKNGFYLTCYLSAIFVATAKITITELFGQVLPLIMCHKENRNEFCIHHSHMEAKICILIVYFLLRWWTTFAPNTGVNKGYIKLSLYPNHLLVIGFLY